MTNAELVICHYGSNDRMKEIQAVTREADQQGIILQDDHLAQQPYILGSSVWELEQKRIKARRELKRRGLSP